MLLNISVDHHKYKFGAKIHMKYINMEKKKKKKKKKETGLALKNNLYHSVYLYLFTPQNNELLFG